MVRISGDGGGTTDKASVMYDPHTHEPRGFGFVTMETVEEAHRRIERDGNHGQNRHGRKGDVAVFHCWFSALIIVGISGSTRTPTPGRYYGPPKRHDNERPYDPRPYDSRYSRDFEHRGGGRGWRGSYEDRPPRDHDRGYRDYDRGYGGGRDYDRGGRYDERRNPPRPSVSDGRRHDSA
ncbi:hypothetical protein OG21DRAFT_1479546 [Imleria badia]|nr:hypothetical protein OG21DRAFT_1479546 [Imleria badia]